MTRRADESFNEEGLARHEASNPLPGPYSTASRPPYEQVSSSPAASASATTAPSSLPSITTYWANPQPFPHQPDHFGGDPYHEPVSPESPIDPAALQFALPPNIFQTGPPSADLGLEPPSADAFAAISTAYYDDHQHLDNGSDSDRIPLATSAEPISGASNVPPIDASPCDSTATAGNQDGGQAHARSSRMLGFDLDPGYTAGGSRQRYGNSLSPDGANRRSRSPSTSGALQRTASIMRAMSQRVVDITGGGEALEQQAFRDQSRSPSADGRRSHLSSSPMLVDTSYPSQVFAAPLEKKADSEFVVPQPPPLSDYHRPMPNPLRGKSLGIFSANNPFRLRLCDLLMLPWVESLILVLIVLQAVLLAVEAAPDVWSSGNARPDRWGKSAYDWAMVGLFIVFTMEIMARVIVSGFVFNAAEYSTIDRKKGMRHGVRAAVTEQYQSFFQPQRQRSVKRPPVENYGPSSFARSFTFMQGQPLPSTYEEQQRMQLARRAFLRHSFNRLDFVAVVSFWVSFALGISGVEHKYHLYVFRMLSCLRIVRLLGITKGNAVSCPSLPFSQFASCLRRVLDVVRRRLRRGGGI